MKTINWKEISTKLSKPIKMSWRIANPPKGGKWDTSKHYQAIPYIDARDVMNRLDKVVGIQSWSDSYKLIDEKTIQCRLTIHNISKSDVGDISTFSPMKGAYSDALKRAAVKFGIGRFLYETEKIFVKVNQYGEIQSKDKLDAQQKKMGIYRKVNVEKINKEKYIAEKEQTTSNHTQQAIESAANELILSIQNSKTIEELTALKDRVEKAIIIIPDQELALNIQEHYSEKLYKFS